MEKEEVIGRVLPQFFPEHWLDPPGLVFTDFPSRIRIGYVLRGAGNYSYLCDDEFSGFSVTLTELHAAALENLAGLPSAEISLATVAGGAEGWIHTTEDNFAAVRILLPQVQEEFHREMGEEFMLSLPHRDDCFCWSLRQSAERQEQHAADALASFLQEPYNLTPDLLLCSHSRFDLHRRQAIAEPGAANPLP